MAAVVAAKRARAPHSRTQDSARLEANRKRNAETARIHEMYERHDTDKSGGLHDGQLKTFMQEYVKTIPGNESKVVTDEEMKYVMSIADHCCDGEVEAKDITEAVATWQALLGDQDVIASRFSYYDKDSSGELDASQVAEVLKDLNGGNRVTTEEVNWVIESTDGRVDRPPSGSLTQDELKVAVAVWYTRVSENEKGKKSSACSIL